MQTILAMPVKKPVLILLCFFLLLPGFSQDSPSLNIRGIAELDMEPLSGASAILYEGSTQISTERTGADGRFSFRLEANRQYTIQVMKEGFVSKRISFNTSMPEDEKGVWTNEFSIGLVKYCDGVDYSVLDEPVDVIEFDPKRREYISNRDYVTKMRPRIEKVLINYEECLLDKYETSVRKADQLANQKNYEEAIASYETALSVYPDESYPKKQIAEIQALARKEMMQDAAFDNAIKDADALFSQERYEDALAAYRKASALKPQDAYAKQRISEAETAYNARQNELKEQRALEDAYNQALVKAGTAYTQKDYSTAEALYRQASEIKPSEALPQSRLAEIGKILEQKAAEEAKTRETQQAYSNAVTKAEALQKNKEYEAAKEQYALALSIKPGEAYPRSKMTEIDRAVEAEARTEEIARATALENEYQAVLKEADALFAAKDYDGAEAVYRKAQDLKPADSYPRQRIIAMDAAKAADQAARDKAIEDGYKTAIGAANTAITQKNYEAARTNLQKALEYKSGDAYATGRISEVDFLVAEEKKALEMQQQVEKQYEGIVAEADGYFDNRDFEHAREQYSQAMKIKPGDSYAMQKLSEISDIVASENAARKKQQEDEYAGLMAKGAEALARKDYTSAITAFEQAMSVKPGDAAAASKLSAARQVVTENENKAAAETEKKEAYGQLLADADQLLSREDYIRAQEAFQKAAAIFPAEAYPRQKLAEISGILEAREKAMQEVQALEHAYQTAIAGADKSFRVKDYAAARDEYKRALQLKPGESYPEGMIAEAEALLLAQEKAKTDAQQRSDSYASAVNAGNDLFEKKAYKEARAKYEMALEQISGDIYATNQISQIDKLLAAKERLELEAQERQQQYQAFIASADEAYDEGRYAQSLEGYEKALKVEPASAYARQRIEKIGEINRILADQESKSVARIAIQPATTSNASPGDLAFTSSTERNRYFSDLVKAYPEGITLEIYREKYKETLRYIVIRNAVAKEFRKIRFLTFGGVEYTVNGKPITQLYFDSQIRQREGEQYKEIVMQ